MANVGAGSRNGGKGNVRVKHKNGAGADGQGIWSQPALLNLLADLLFFLAVMMLAWEGTQVLQRLPVAPLKQLIVTAPVEQVSPAQIEQAARTAIAGNFFTVDLEQARVAFERLPWVRHASLRRVWPDGIELALEEHHPVARWTPQDGEPRLVNDHGEVFSAVATGTLPVFSGPEESAPRVLERYREFSETLATIKRIPVVVRLSPREAWQLKLDDGVVLELGRDQPKAPLAERLVRFTTHYDAIKSRLQAIGVVDMRYPNGFALRPSVS
ncbi:MAG: FtsQ-type POTRA domain-containing protein [Rhodocyclales bacterium]|nr:FtsQ-type POTRA domain-containing protein [Rhodocyclales bacterium]